MWRNWRKKRLCKKQGKHNAKDYGAYLVACTWCGRC